MNEKLGGENAVRRGIEYCLWGEKMNYNIYKLIILSILSYFCFNNITHTMKMKFFILLTLAVIHIHSFAQPQCFLEHFGPEDGLPQHSVMSILQDKKGFMWFSTWNGLSKFDGYNFYTYKILGSNEAHVKSNRIDFICEDKYGYIWTLPYNKEPYRFDPKTETFTGLKSIKQYQNFSFQATKILPQKSGKVWLISNNAGCVCITDSTFNIETYNINNNKILGNKVYSIYEDFEKNSWILTNNGLYNVPSDNSGIKSYFSEKRYTEIKTTINFFSVVELKNEIWFGSDDGKVWIYDKKNKQFKLFEVQATTKITDLKKITDNQLLICSENDGFFIYNISQKKIKKYNTSNLSNMCSNRVISSYIDRSNRIWIELDCFGISKFDLKTETIKHYKLNVEKVISDIFPPNLFIIEDIENRIWIHTRGGGFGFYDEKTDVLLPFFNEPNSPQWRFSNMMHAGFSDKQGNLWLSTRSHGIEKVVFNKNIFQSSVVDPNISSTINNDIRSIFEDKDQNLWISTKGEKVFVYDTYNKQKGYINQDGIISHSSIPLKGITYCITQDNKQNIWLGTKGDGLYKLTPTSDKGHYKIKHFKHDSSDPHSLSNNNIYNIFQDEKNRIWIGTYGGGLNLIYDEENGKFYNSKNHMKQYPSDQGWQIRVISTDKYGNICIGTTLGLIVFSSDFENIEDIEYKLYTKQSVQNNGLIANDIYDICTTQNGETYIATFGGGISLIQTTDSNGFPLQFKSVTTSEGLPSDVILSVTEDLQGKLWITTEGNLTKYDPIGNSLTTYSEISRLIDGKNFSEGAKCTSKSGLIYLGYSKGFISINPDAIESNSFKPYIAFTQFQISNKNVSIGEGSPLKLNIDDVNHIELNHKQNFISIEFAALDYIDPKRINYAYKLENFDNDWIFTSKQRMANYTNLAPGKYLFRVKSTNCDGIWLDNEHSLSIEIKPAFWHTKWAYLIYIVLFIAILYIVLRIIFTFYRLKDKVLLEQEQTEMKTRFFTDISHEIRTPLTMIVSPIENIIEDKETSESSKYQLQLVLKNANRMLRMVNQILDFRKIQKKKLNIQETEVAIFIEDVCNSFKDVANKRNINLELKNEIGNQTLWFDRDSVEKLIFNLLSNAFKHTSDGKTISINIKSQPATISIEIIDQGSGMTKDVLNKIFTRFASFNKDKNQPSTGIGLSIVKEVTDKHHAKISIESEIDSGSCFSISFPKGIDHFKDDTNVLFDYYENNTHHDNKTEHHSEEFIETDEITKNKKESILIVEDNNDLRMFIKAMLNPHFEIVEAGNGLEGYNSAIKEIPDFIISDIMMPEMDGIELLQKIRTSAETSHIPFILLSAKADIETKLEGLEFGADDYITKPFSVRYLKARINNIMQQRRSFYNIHANQNKQDTIENNTESNNGYKITASDKIFLERIEEEIRNNIENNDFFVENLIGKMAMSRSVFVKKLKSITGFTPLEFMRNMKINYAAELIEKQEYTIKEIAFMIGISDTKYFTQIFKKTYGMTPSEYRNIKK